MQRPGLCYWPFRQLSYKFIRSVTIDGQIIQFQPIENCHRQGFNAVIQMSAGDIFKRAMLAVDPVARRYGGRLFLPVHDELVFTVPRNRLHAFVRHAVEVMERPPAPWFTIPIKVEVKVGPNYDLKDTSAYTAPWWLRLWRWAKRQIGRLRRLF
jgi:DNA polymerase I-like protein with 3'-5' exonuclease and polymerase domains